MLLLWQKNTVAKLAVCVWSKWKWCQTTSIDSTYIPTWNVKEMNNATSSKTSYGYVLLALKLQLAAAGVFATVHFWSDMKYFVFMSRILEPNDLLRPFHARIHSYTSTAMESAIPFTQFDDNFLYMDAAIRWCGYNVRFQWFLSHVILSLIAFIQIDWNMKHRLCSPLLFSNV